MSVNLAEVSRQLAAVQMQMTRFADMSLNVGQLASAEKK
jgi:hypothetical protein